MLQVIIKMAFLLKNCVIFPQLFAKRQKKFNFFGKVLKFHRTEQDKVFQTLNLINFCNFNSKKTQNFKIHNRKYL